MKKSIFSRAILCSVLFASTVAYGQLKVEHSGRILAGTFIDSKRMILTGN